MLIETNIPIRSHSSRKWDTKSNPDFDGFLQINSLKLCIQTGIPKEAELKIYLEEILDTKSKYL